jgi:hypothetical protein
MQHAWGNEIYEKQEWKNHLEDPGIEVWITLKIIFKKQDS